VAEGKAVPKIAVGPQGSADWACDAVRAGGGDVVDVSEAQGLVWTDFDTTEELIATLARNPKIAWVQVPFSGVETYMPYIDGARTWTSAKGVFGGAVAELALGLLIGGMRHVAGYAREKQWSEDHGRTLFGARVTILGAGGIAQSLISMLQPFGCRITVVRNRQGELLGVDEVVTTAKLNTALSQADAVVMALALTPQTIGIMGRKQFEMMQSHAWLVNVGRGKQIVTDDLVWALEAGEIGGAALDVTDPEPLPLGHPLWSMPNCIITPHVGNTAEMVPPLLAFRITENVRRFAAGETLVGIIDQTVGY
jgi:phosphoglycerate dehydrogenase-like enzyme